jgi:predicted small secreted protein
MNNRILAGVVVGIGAFLFVIYLLMGMHYRNGERSLRNLFTAKKQDVEASHDKMKKVIFQKAGITQQYAGDFERIYPNLIAGRYKGNGDGSLMKFVVEANPSFDTSLYKDLSQAVEAERANFLNVQRSIIDVQQVYNTYIITEPGSYFLPDNLEPLKYTVISSTDSKNAVETGVDNDVDLFAKPATK